MSVDVLSQIWPEWKIEGKPLGKGSYGVVYKAVRTDHNVESYAAIKVISIPSDSSEVDTLRSEGMDMNATKSYLEGIVNDFVSEIQVMESMKGVQNIVSVEDYKVVERTNEVGWDIYIRMELLTPFNTYICSNALDEEAVIKLGCDICTALEICGKRNVIHRDIKPENIFINDFGHFKLGDFGIARKMENVTGGLSQKGTFNYMAPEVATSNEYDARVDTYSLGIVLYRMLNGNRLPFLTDQQFMNPNERRNAVDRRIRGEALPPPCDASPAMADLILRACAFNPNDRFSSATEMKQALMCVANGTYPIAAVGGKAPTDDDMTVAIMSEDQTVAIVPEDQTVAMSLDEDKTVATGKNSAKKTAPVVDTFGEPKKKGSKKIIVIAIIALLLIGAGIFAVSQLFRGDDVTLNEKDLDRYSEAGINAIKEIVSNAEKRAEKQDYAGALEIIQKGLNDYRKSETLKDKEKEYSDKLRNQIITDVLSSAEALAADKKYGDALIEIQKCLEKYPDAQELKDKEAEYTAAIASQDIDSILSAAEQQANSGNYDAALSTVKAGLTTYPDSEALNAKAMEYSDILRAEVLTEAATLVGNGNYSAAMTLIKNAQTKYGDHAEYQNAYNLYSSQYTASSKSEALEAAESLASSGDYLGAISILNRTISDLGADDELSAKAKEYEDSYVAEVIEESKSYVNNKQFDDATELVDEALEHFPNNQKLIDQSTAIQYAIPKNFMDVCIPYEMNRNTYLHTGISSFTMSGEQYRNGVTMAIYENGSWFLSNLKGAYSELQFYLGHVDGSAMANVTLTVLLDDDIYSSYKVPSSGLPQLITIPVTGVMQLKIIAEYDAYNGYPTIGLGNMTIKANPNSMPKQEGTHDSNAKNYIEECPPYEMNSNTYLHTGISSFTMGGEQYRNGVTMAIYENGSWFLSNLKGAYSELQFYLGHVDGSAMANVTLIVLLDDDIYTSYKVPSSGLPQLITIPVTGVKQLEIIAEYDAYNGYPTIGLGNMTII